MIILTPHMFMKNLIIAICASVALASPARTQTPSDTSILIAKTIPFARTVIPQAARLFITPEGFPGRQHLEDAARDVNVGIAERREVLACNDAGGCFAHGNTIAMLRFPRIIELEEVTVVILEVRLYEPHEDVYVRGYELEFERIGNSWNIRQVREAYQS